MTARLHGNATQPRNHPEKTRPNVTSGGTLLYQSGAPDPCFPWHVARVLHVTYMAIHHTVHFAPKIDIN